MKYFECKGRRYYCIGQPLLRFFLATFFFFAQREGKKSIERGLDCAICTVRHAQERGDAPMKYGSGIGETQSMGRCSCCVCVPIY